MPLRSRRVVSLLRLAVAGWVGGGAIAEAHPHMFVEYAVLVRFGAGGVESVEVRWTFDEFTSALILRQFDKDGDGKLSPDEVRQVERRHFAETRESQYLRGARRGLSITGAVLITVFGGLLAADAWTRLR